MKKIIIMPILLVILLFGFSTIKVNANEIDNVWNDFTTSLKNKLDNVSDIDKDLVFEVKFTNETLTILMKTNFVSDGSLSKIPLYTYVAEYTYENEVLKSTDVYGYYYQNSTDFNEVEYDELSHKNLYALVSRSILETYSNILWYNFDEIANRLIENTDFGYDLGNNDVCSSDTVWYSNNDFTLNKNGIHFKLLPAFACGIGGMEIDILSIHYMSELQLDFKNGINIDKKYITEGDSVWVDYVNDVCSKWDNYFFIPGGDNYTCSLPTKNKLEIKLANESLQKFENTVVEYKNGVIEITTDTYGYAGSQRAYAIHLAQQAAIKNIDYIAWLEFTIANKVNNFTLEKDGIEFSGTKYSETQEYKDLIDYWCKQYGECEDVSFGHDFLVYDVLRIDLKNGVTAYEKQAVSNNKFLEGAEQKYDGSKDAKLVFKIDADHKLFDKLYINGEEIDKKNYSITEGSTVITFNEEYTKTLKNGKYELKATFTDGKVAETTFTVAKTGVIVNSGIYTGLGIILLLGIVSCSILYTKIRKQSRFPQV